MYIYILAGRRSLWTLLAFTVLAYGDVRTRCPPGLRVSWLWFCRAAGYAALKTMCVLAPLIAIAVLFQYMLLRSLLQTLGVGVTALDPLVRILSQYGPYASVYWVIKADFARSQAARAGSACAVGANCMSRVLHLKRNHSTRPNRSKAMSCA